MQALSIVHRFGLRTQNPRQLIYEIFKLAQLLLHTLGARAVGCPRVVAQLLQPMLVDPFLLVIICHALAVALFLDFLHNFFHVALDILPHGPELFKGLTYFCSFDLTDLGIPLGLFLKEVEVLITDVFEILEERGVEIGNGDFLNLMATLYLGDLICSLNVALLQFP